MPRNAKLCFVLPVVLGFFALACFGPRSEKAGPQGSATASGDSAIDTPRPAELQLLQARVAGLEAELHAVQLTAKADLATPVVATHAAPSTPELARRLPEPATLQAHYDAVLATETPDGRWAPVEENAMVAFFATDSAKGARLERAECRESMCRIRAHFEDRNARAQFLTHIGSPPFDHGGFYRIDETTGAFTLYTARVGRALPSLDSVPAESAP